ncbi:MAG: hypothetical protein N0C86_20155 [Candidatus Thiodiazotropha taylori]|nr:hypothetical protein [Candidatus Thiodiazotropha taylori]MCW4328314.1 hypothetical protein [Candidatus Thiodiazotropha taylori]
MKSVIKQIIGCLAIATLVAVACYFLPVVNTLLGDYLFGFFFAAFILPLGIKWYESHMAKVRAMPKAERAQREKECKEWWRKSSEATTCPSHCYDQRNVDRQLHIFDGFKDR